MLTAFALRLQNLVHRNAYETIMLAKDLLYQMKVNMSPLPGSGIITTDLGMVTLSNLYAMDPRLALRHLLQRESLLLQESKFRDCCLRFCSSERWMTVITCFTGYVAVHCGFTRNGRV